MSESLAVKVAVGMALVGHDYRRFLHTHDPTERLVEAIIGEQVAERRREERDIENHNLAVRIGDNVSRAVVPAINQALTSIARAMRRP